MFSFLYDYVQNIKYENIRAFMSVFYKMFVPCSAFSLTFAIVDNMDTHYTEDTDNDSSVVMHNVSENDPLLSEYYSVPHVLPNVRFPSCRLVLIFMGCLGFINLYSLRANLSIALVAMVNHTQHVPLNHSENNLDDICKTNESAGTKEDMKGGEFDWDSHTQGTVIAAFFYGYIMTQVWTLSTFGH